MTTTKTPRLIALGSAKALTKACDLFGVLEAIDPTCRYLP